MVAGPDLKVEPTSDPQAYHHSRPHVIRMCLVHPGLTTIVRYQDGLHWSLITIREKSEDSETLNPVGL